jgi:hypothetical protein
MPFTLSAAQTINGVTNSYILTGSGNLDDLATAASSVGFTRSGEIYTFDPGGTARILAMSGTLTENRKGTRTVNIRGNGHICWSYGASSVATLGLLDAAFGVYTGTVNINYEPTALAAGFFMNMDAEAKCFAGAGTFNGVSGSLSYYQSGRSDLDAFDNATLLAFDKFKLYLATTGGAYSHIWKPDNRTTTTDKTICIFVKSDKGTE